MKTLHLFSFLVLAGFSAAACTSILGDFTIGGGDGGGGDSGGDTNPDAPSGPVTIDQMTVRMGILRSATLKANQPVTWSVMETGGGTIDANGKYISPLMPGTYHVIATSMADAKQTATSIITVVDLQVQLVAGVEGGEGNIDGSATRAHFQNPEAIAFSETSTGLKIYIADTDNHTIRVWDDSVKKVTTLAGLANTPGTTDGTGNTARFHSPQGLAVDPGYNVGGLLYVADTQNNCIRSVDPSSGVVKVFSGSCGASGSTVNGTATNARFNQPTVMTMDTSLFSTTPTVLEVCEEGSSDIRRVSLADGSVTTLVSPVYSCQVARDRYNEKTFFTDDGQGNVRRFKENPISPYTPTIDPTLGKSPGGTYPSALGDTNGYSGGGNGYLYIGYGSGNGSYIMRYNDSSGSFEANAAIGSQSAFGYADGAGTSARFESISAFGAVPEYERLYVVDRGLDAVRLVDLSGTTLNVSTVFGAARAIDRVNGPSTTARFSGIFGVAVDDMGAYYVSDAVLDGGNGLLNDTIRKYDPTSGMVGDFAGVQGAPTMNPVDGAKGAGTFGLPFFSTYDNGVLYVIDAFANAVRAVDSNGKITTIAGQLGTPGKMDGTGVAAQFNFGFSSNGGAGITSDHAGHLYVSDGGNYAIRKIDITSGAVTTIAGGTKGSMNGTGKAAQFVGPAGLAVDGNNLYVVDPVDCTLRKIDLTTFAVTSFIGFSGMPGYVDGDASKGQLDTPYDIIADGIGNLYVSELPQSTQHSGTIRRVDIATSTISTFVGSRTAYGISPGPRSTATVNCPLAMSLTPTGDLAFGDYCDYVIGVVTPL